MPGIDQNDPRFASRLPGAFAFMEKRPFDLVVILRTVHEKSSQLKRLELFYAENARVSSFLFDFTEPKYMGDAEKFREACVRAVFKEVRSRTVARDQFVVWFYNERDRDTLFKNGAMVAGEDENLQRSLEELIEHARIIGKDEEPDLIED